MDFSKFILISLFVLISSFAFNSVRGDGAPDEFGILKVHFDKCFEPKEEGVCRAIMKRFYYDPERKDCVQFDYGGCGGNGNNFREKKQCNRGCRFPIRMITTGILQRCFSPRTDGRCRGHFKRYFFNAQTGKCEEFYGCIDDKKNNFSKIDDCQKDCENIVNEMKDKQSSGKI